MSEVPPGGCDKKRIHSISGSDQINDDHGSKG